MERKNISLISKLLLLLLNCAMPTIYPKAQTVLENIPSNTIQAYSWWNLLHYTIDLMPDYNAKFISGTNQIEFRASQTGKKMQIDLQSPMSITAITWNNKPIHFTKDSDAYLITFPVSIKKGETETLTVHFEGHPHEAVNPPWGESGWIWATDQQGRPWMSIACEGSGASVWLPCKNALYDEPDSGVLFNITVPDTLAAVANGRLQKKTSDKDRKVTYTGKVTSPINGYNICPYIGKYITWHENFPGINGNLDCDYWVLDYNLDKAQQHLRQADTMLHCFEYWLGPYPFYEDSYKLVEAPFLGMEHQSAIAYGNGFANGYINGNLSGTSWGLQFDFILIHESGHEWFGNSITANKDGESWIHEGFTKYLETLYTDFVFGTEAGNDYALGICKRIKNDEPVLGSGTSDAYNKASAMLHMIRQVMGDSAFRGLLYGLNKTFYHRTVSTDQILSYINESAKHNFTKVFNQYLRTTGVPLLEYSFQNGSFQYRWSNCVKGFDMPVKISFDSVRYQFIYPATHWQKLLVARNAAKNFAVDRNFYIKTQESKSRL